MGRAYTCSGSECGWRTDRQSHARQSVSRSGQYVARLYSLHLEREIGMRIVNARRTGCVGGCHRAKVCRCVRNGCNDGPIDTFVGGGADTDNCWTLLWNTMVGRNKGKE